MGARFAGSRGRRVRLLRARSPLDRGLRGLDRGQPFTSKYDYYLQGLVELTPEEAWGLELYEGDGTCNACHPSEPGSNGEPPLFTDFTFDNLGIPRNPDLPFYSMPRKWNPDGYDWIDPGLGGFLASQPDLVEHAADNLGKHKVPTLRNVDLRPEAGFVKAFGHNGFFDSLEEIVHFYNTRDVEDWPAPEVAENVNTDELGDLGLTTEEEAAVVAFLRTLSDGYVLPVQKVAISTPTIRLTAIQSGAASGPARLAFDLPRNGEIRLEIFNLRGLRIAVPAAGWYAAGSHRIDLPVRDLASGVYLARLSQGPHTSTTKLSVIR